MSAPLSFNVDSVFSKSLAITPTLKMPWM